jgi:hypothetical protein
MKVKWLAAGVALLLAAGVAYGQDAWLNAHDFGRTELILSDTASDSERLGADVFADYWKRLTGEQPARSSSPTPGSVHVWIGASGVPERLLAQVDLEELGTDGVVIKTVAPDPSQDIADPHLLIIGGRERGTMYGVYEFFKRAMGVRWLTPDAVHVPADVKSVPTLDYRHVPTFIYRQSTYWGDWPDKEEYERANHISSYPGFGLFVHTAYSLVPPEKYFETHPEFYSLIDGKRVAPHTFDWHDSTQYPKHPDELAQLCWSNPELADVIAEQLKQLIAANPEPKIWSVSQMDWAGHCQCDACKEIDEREGTPMGSMLTLVNRVAEAIEVEYPDHFIETLAYQHTRRAPKTLHPRNNVIVRLCSIECDFAKTLNDPSSDVNAAFAKDIRDWAQIADKLWIWDYVPTYISYSAPHPNFHVLQPNLEFFARHNVIGVFEQGAEHRGAEFSWLRGYMLTELMWNPQADAQKLQTEFIDLYYQEAAPFVHEYIALITDKVRSENIFMSCFDPAVWMDAEMVAKAEAIFARAFAAVKDEETRRRVDEAYLPVQWSGLVCSPKPEIEGTTLTLRRPESISLEEYKEKAEALGMRHKETLEYTERAVAGQLGSRHVTAEIVPIENDRYLLWTVPSLRGAIIRWRDKELGAEMLMGYQRYWALPGKWEDWVNTPGVAEAPVAEQYEIVRHDPDALVLRGVADNGLEVVREMRLEGDALQVTLRLVNPTEAPIAASAKLHPELSLQGTYIPRILIKRNGLWESRENRAPIGALTFGELVIADEYEETAYFVDEKSIGVTCTFDPREVDSLLYFFNSEKNREHANLELILDHADLPPGGERSLTGTYRVIDARPDATGSGAN